MYYPGQDEIRAITGFFAEGSVYTEQDTEIIQHALFAVAIHPRSGGAQYVAPQKRQV